MSNNEIRFDDGAAYERFMGHWSQLTGRIFLDWLTPQQGLRWLDVGCGNGAFTELVVDGCAPAAVHGIDPAEGQLTFARKRPAARVAEFALGDAMGLSFEANSFDVAVMPLVIFFVPVPSQGVAEMARVVAPGGTVAAYAWDMPGGGLPYAPLLEAMRAMGIDVPTPPSPEASSLAALQSLWEGAGLQAVETREIVVARTFADFDDYWTTVLGGPSVAAKLAAMSAADMARLQATMRERLPFDKQGHITVSARANAVKGQVPEA